MFFPCHYQQKNVLQLNKSVLDIIQNVIGILNKCIKHLITI